jgi:asparagine synthase (glutamine-hydrolysing)
MCGIAGIFHYGEPERPVDRALLERMTRALLHRGPDGEGYHLDGPVGLGHRRLAIVDLSPTGSQPMSSDDGQLFVTYNGELYNHRDFRPLLEAKRRFRGTSDTETLVNLLAERGKAALEDLVGIFAFAAWDAREKSLLLVRDMLGVKQLYFHDDGRRVAFASEVKALLELGDVPSDVDPEGVNQYLHFHTPLFERTFFQGIRQLRPGQWLEFRARRAPRSGTYFRVEDFRPLDGDLGKNVDDLREMLERVVRDQLMSDVPVGAFLSGGIDSSAVAAYAVRSGTRPRCFGVHFSDQGVIDERPYQEAVAKTLGVELELVTLDGSTFPSDMARLLASQDMPLIGPAMIPMSAVSELAARRVKVCMGGQAADEIFGGYARYALSEPLAALRNWMSARGGPRSNVGTNGGNLRKQLLEKNTLFRLARTAMQAGDWRSLYFNNFAKVAEKDWLALLDRELVSRESCWRSFTDTIESSPAPSASARAMHWDMQTYLPGLFSQDDRMSMRHSLESRVPLADPRLVKLAFRVPFDQKFRGGSSKWLLRQAVSDVLPADVLNRRKVGFDTPAERWMRETHRDFVHDTLLSDRARQRGWFHPNGIRALLERPTSTYWFDRAWKLLCIEVWARSVLDARREAAASSARTFEVSDRAHATPPAVDVAASRAPFASFRDAAQEIIETRPARALSRLGWELGMKSGLVQLKDLAGRRARPEGPIAFAALPFGANAALVREQTGDDPEALASLQHAAKQAARGRILGFGRHFLDFGHPIDWHLNPRTGRRWPSSVHWSRVLAAEPDVGDVKVTWEAGRFPQAFFFARAAVFFPEERSAMAQAFAEQVRSFLDANPHPRGVHWSSGLEIAIRVVAWSFACSTFEQEAAVARVLPLVRDHFAVAAAHIERHIEYARKSVYNDHLLYEALALVLVGSLLDVPEASRWAALGRSILEEESDRQFYADGAYLLDSHNYERTSLQCYLFLSAILRARGEVVPPPIVSAMERALDFLHAHLNAGDGRLPNFGANDGSRPLLLSTCDFSDFRPELQAASIATRGERCFAPGRWDEASVWLFGREAASAKVVPRARATRSFAPSGYHVLRSADGEASVSFRCGDVRERFSQADMLSIDVFWRGHNVVADAGSYRYNGADRWHHHFHGTPAHSTVSIDQENQMVHHRRFRNLYWTRARLLEFDDGAIVSRCAGEHEGYTRLAGGCVHRRAVLLARSNLLVVSDRVVGTGPHRSRLHYLGGDFPHSGGGFDPVVLETPDGPFTIAIFDESGRAVRIDVVRGQTDPPQGWLSRYYLEKVPVPSLVAEANGPLPQGWLTVMGAGGAAEVSVRRGTWTVRQGATELSFTLSDGLFVDVRASSVDTPFHHVEPATSGSEVTR